jgi:ribosome recycling factor
MGILEDTKSKMTQILEHLKTEFKGIRANRAHPDMLTGIFVEVYGAKTKLRDLANVTAAEARMLLVTPFDKSCINAISKGIQNSNLGFNPQIDGSVIRVPVPPMDESKRQAMAGVAKKKGDESKVAIRQARQTGNDEARKQKKDGSLTEDELKKLEKKIQEATDDACKEVDKLLAVKEKEILEV